MGEKYKLTYFNGRGRAEPIRLMLAYGKAVFEDNRVNHADWPGLKNQMPWGHMPVLEVNGKEISESFAVMRYLANKFNLYGKDDFESAKVDEYGYVLGDLVGEIFKFVFANESQKASTKEALVSTHLPNVFKKLGTIKNSNGGSFLLGQRVTFPDMILANIVDTLEHSLGSRVLDPYPEVMAIKGSVFGLPGVQEYVAKRPPPP